MNAQELFLKNGQSAKVWFCEKCRYVALHKELAENCCEQRKCSECGKVCEQKYYTLCNVCLEKDRQKKETERFDKAEKISAKNYAGKIIDGETVYDCLDDYLDNFTPEEYPDYVYATKEIPFPKLDAYDLLEPYLESL